MSNPYVGEIRLMANNFPPAGWAMCNGQLLPIAENETLFQLIGTTYGGDGQETFGLPNLQGRVPMHQGNGHVLAEAAGVESVTLTTQQMPLHNHALLCSTAQSNTNNVANNIPATMLAAGTASAYGNVPPIKTINPASISPVGGTQPHDNIQPYQAINFWISLFGVFPSPT